MKTPEAYEKDDICKYLKSIGAWYHRAHTGGFGASGAPDIIGCYNGRFFGIEVKREGKKPTRLQEMRMREIAEAGGLAFWGTAVKVIGELKFAFLLPFHTKATLGSSAY